MNETPATGAEWPGAKERRLRLAEAIELIRRLWTDERVTFEGDYYRTDRATIYDRPDEPVPIYVAASGPLAAKLAGRVGDGFIATSGKKQELYEELLANLAEGARPGRPRRRRRCRSSSRSRSPTTTTPSSRATPAAGGPRSR